MLTRRRIIALGLVLGFAVSGCVDQNLIGPTDAQLKKGGIPATPASDPVELLEYYVYHEEEGKNFVHIIASGTFPRLNLDVAQDYIFNGIADDNYSIFFEVSNSAPYYVGQEDFGVGKEGQWVEVGENTNIWHIDIPWHGEAFYWIYSDPMDPDPILDAIPFPNYPYANVDGLGGDPYAFHARFQEEDGDYIAGFQPQGIILGGEVKTEIVGMEERNVRADTLPGEDPYHPGEIIHSYAIFGGDPGNTFSVDQVIVHDNTVTCDLRTVKERIDKKFFTKQVAQVSVSAQVILKGYTGEAIGSFTWIDVKLASGADDPNKPEFYDSFSSTHDAEPWASGWTVSAQIETTDAPPPTAVRLAIPYIYSSDVQEQVVYDPGHNTNGEGWTTLNASDDPLAPSDWYKFPYVLTDPIPVDCGN